MPANPVNCLKCQTGMHRTSRKRDGRGAVVEHWRCQQCGAELTTRNRANDDPRIAKPQ